MKIQSLNGEWLYRIGKGRERVREVPFSALCVGHSECRRIFSLDERSDRVFLKFDGITYHASVYLNGVKLGEMLPYCEYVFEVTGSVKADNNELLVELEDIAPSFGPTAGWENYGGIIRDVSLLYAGKGVINDAFFYSELLNGYKDARYTLELQTEAPEGAEISVSLFDGDGVADAFIAPVNAEKVEREIKNVKLWSTDAPDLYTLSVALTLEGRELDRYECKVGFREIKCDRHRFIINGKPELLVGVCKHEMIGDQGHTVSEELIERDLRMIKEMGCNFVRLVHYPHSKKTLEIADRIGLMVSEEPGLWWSRTEIPEVSEGSLEVLKRTVLRDRNHPSVAFWLAFNECRFTEQFLIDSARVCRKYDPSRMVSGANCMSDEDTLKYYNNCGFDFYTMHPYSDTTERAKRSASILNDKPLVFTEWGGYHVYDNPHLLKDFIGDLYDMYKRGSDEGAIAGAFFWYFAECNDFGRAGPACKDGVLKEALVDAQRRPTLIYDAFVSAWADVRRKKRAEDKYYYEPLTALDMTPLKYVNGCGNFEIAFSGAMESSYEKEKFNGMRYRRMSVGCILQRSETVGMARIPYTVSDGDTVTFGGGKNSGAVTLLGAVSSGKGYPISGEYGEEAATLTVTFSDGREESFSLRNGIEITTVYTTFGSSRIEPVGEKTVPFARFGYDKNFENYIINTLTLELEDKNDIEGVTVASKGNGYDLLIYGVYC